MGNVTILNVIEANELLEFWTMVFDSLTLLDKIIVKEADKNKASVQTIREDVNRATITAQREHKIIMKLVSQQESIQ